VDALLVLYVPPLVTRPEDVARAIVRGTEAARRTAAERGEPIKPVATCFMGSHGVAEGLLSLQESHIPSYSFPESAAIALARAVRLGRWRARPDGVIRRFADVDREAAAEVLAKARRRAAPDAPAWLEPGEIRALLAAYRIATAASAPARTAEEAAAAARRIGFPVAVKLASSAITHKSDVGGVVLDVADEAGVWTAYADIARRVASHGAADAMSGVTIQAMVRDGVEVIVGMTLDPSFGPLLMFGLGGVQVELLKDVAFRVHPLTDRDARELVRSVRGFPLLEGYRGAPAADIDGIEEVLLRLSQLLSEHEGIVELDLNPVKAGPPGRGCVVVDARVAVRADESRPERETVTASPGLSARQGH
jgi:acyl-CoA synthetase (NDP forming)